LNEDSTGVAFARHAARPGPGPTTIQLIVNAAGARKSRRNAF
jgi:hypothetical protein